MVEVVQALHQSVQIRATVRKVGVYLDNFAIIELAKGDSARRCRFIQVVSLGADLMLSAVGAAELLGPRGRSRHLVGEFLDQIGPHWFPIDSGIVAVTEREAMGCAAPDACCDTAFLEKLFAAINLLLHGEQRLAVVEPEFFALTNVLNAMEHDRENLRGVLSRGDTALQDRWDRLARVCARNPAALDATLNVALPLLPYDSRTPATFAFTELQRVLALESRAFRAERGDMADLCHAVLGAAYAHFVALDSAWCRRVRRIPKPHSLAKVYGPNELDAMIDGIADVLQHNQLAAAAAAGDGFAS